MSEQTGTSKRSFGQWVRDTWAAGMAIRVVVEKEGRRIVDLPLNVIVIAGILAPWALGIGVVVAVIAGYRMYTERPGPTEGAGETPEDASAEAGTALDTMTEEAVAEAGITPPPGTEPGERAPGQSSGA